MTPPSRPISSATKTVRPSLRAFAIASTSSACSTTGSPPGRTSFGPSAAREAAAAHNFDILALRLISVSLAFERQDALFQRFQFIGARGGRYNHTKLLCFSALITPLSADDRTACVTCAKDAALRSRSPTMSIATDPPRRSGRRMRATAAIAAGFPDLSGLRSFPRRLVWARTPRFRGVPGLGKRPHQTWTAIILLATRGKQPTG